MKGRSFIYTLFIVSVIGLFTGCSKGDGDFESDNSDDGFAVKSIEGKEFVFYRNGDFNFSSLTNNGETLVSLNSTTSSIAYDKSDPICSYQQTGRNTALYELRFYHKAYVPYYDSYTYGFNSYQLSLVFTSINGGTYSGTRNNGSKTESRNGTFLIK